ncbi:MAG: NUDIX hydrolase [Myxococcales bacterium]|nr:NUDIX hydrolase [Myxococcales bacterium]
MAHTHGPTEVRFCVYCGDKLSRRRIEGRERKVCAGCGRIHYREAKVAVATAVVRGRQLLLVKRRHPPEKGKWGLPGGYLDAGEDPERAAARETLEETGLVVECCELLDVLFNPGPDGADVSIVYRAVASAATPVAADDAEEARFFAIDALPELAFQSTRRAVAALRERSNP